MEHYHIWVNLKESHKDLEFAAALDVYLGHLVREGLIEGWTLERRKFGFGPPGLPEFHIDIRAKDLAQLDAAFHRVAPRSGELEAAHRAVYAAVTDFTSGLYRDFPDAERRARRPG
jgi:hypothetical protein